MAEQHTYNPYTLADIERYLQGKMNAGEMHAMEKAALQDPFLSDAIEGYNRQPFSLSHRHLNEITASLSAQNEEARVIAMPVKNRNWWKTAAAVLLVAATGIVALILIKGGPHNELAKQTNTPVFTNDTPAAAANAIAAAPADTNKADNGKYGLVENNKPGAKPGNSVLANKDESVTTLRSNEPATDVNKNLGDDKISADEERKYKADSSLLFTSVTVQKSAPVSGKYTITPDTTKLNTNALFNAQQYNYSTSNNGYANLLTDNNANPMQGPAYRQNLNMANYNTSANAALPVYNFKKEYFLRVDSTATASAGAVIKPFAGGRGEPADKFSQSSAPVVATLTDTKVAANKSAETARLKGVTGLNIVLKPDPNFDTVPITYLNNRSRTRTIITDSSLLPQGGWESFRDYVSRQLHKEIDTTDVPDIEGNVELEFTVDDRGNAKDIKIIRSLNTESDNQAMDLVKKWPAWITTKKHKRGKVVIQF